MSIMICLYGSNIRHLIAASGKTQVELADASGISKYRINQIARHGSTSKVKPRTAELLADALGVSMADLRRERPPMVSRTGDELSVAEAAVLDMYRQLLPVDQAKVLLKIKEVLDSESSDESHGGSR